MASRTLTRVNIQKVKPKLEVTSRYSSWDTSSLFKTSRKVGQLLLEGEVVVGDVHLGVSDQVSK